MYKSSKLALIMPRWVEPRRHTVVCSFVCLCVCVCNAYLSNRLLLSAEISNTGRSQYFMKTKFGRIAIKGFVLELWRDLLAWTVVACVRASFRDNTVHSWLHRA